MLYMREGSRAIIKEKLSMASTSFNNKPCTVLYNKTNDHGMVYCVVRLDNGHEIAVYINELVPIASRNLPNWW